MSARSLERLAEPKDFESLSAFLELEHTALASMASAIEAPVAARTTEYVGSLLAPIREAADLSPAREALMVNDPYFIGASHGRLRFHREEVVANLQSLMTVPSVSVIRWSENRVAPVQTLDAVEASRETYPSASPASEADLSRVAAAYARINTNPPFGLIVAAGIRRLSLATSCVGSSSISSLPGYAMIQAPTVTAATGRVSELDYQAAFGPRQINGLVHEAVHGLLFLAECMADRQLVHDGARSRVASPWSGNPLDSYQFAQALIVWHVLLAFWTEFDPNAPEREVAARGFRSQGAVPSGARLVLETIREEVAPDFLEVLMACQATSSRAA